MPPRKKNLSLQKNACTTHTATRPTAADSTDASTPTSPPEAQQRRRKKRARTSEGKVNDPTTSQQTAPSAAASTPAPAPAPALIPAAPLAEVSNALASNPSGDVSAAAPSSAAEPAVAVTSALASLSGSTGADPPKRQGLRPRAAPSTDASTPTPNPTAANRRARLSANKANDTPTSQPTAPVDAAPTPLPGAARASITVVPLAGVAEGSSPLGPNHVSAAAPASAAEPVTVASFPPSPSAQTDTGSYSASSTAAASSCTAVATTLAPATASTPELAQLADPDPIPAAPLPEDPNDDADAAAGERSDSADPAVTAPPASSPPPSLASAPTNDVPGHEPPHPSLNGGPAGLLAAPASVQALVSEHLAAIPLSATVVNASVRGRSGKAEASAEVCTDVLGPPSIHQMRSAAISPSFLSAETLLKDCLQEQKALVARSDKGERSFALALANIQKTKEWSQMTLRMYLESNFSLKMKDALLGSLLRYGKRVCDLLCVSANPECEWLSDFDSLPHNRGQMRTLLESVHKCPWSREYEDKLICFAYSDWLRCLVGLGQAAIRDWNEKTFAAHFTAFFKDHSARFNSGSWRRSGPPPADFPDEPASSKRKRARRQKDRGMEASPTTIWFVGQPELPEEKQDVDMDEKESLAVTYSEARSDSDTSPVEQSASSAAADVPTADSSSSNNPDPSTAVLDSDRNNTLEKPEKRRAAHVDKFTPEMSVRMAKRARRATGGKPKKREAVIDLSKLPDDHDEDAVAKAQLLETATKLYKKMCEEQKKPKMTGGYVYIRMRV